MRVLVTGGAGFIGSHLCGRLLDDGDEIVVVDRFDELLYDADAKEANAASWSRRPGATLVRGDVLDADLLDRVLGGGAFDGVVHLAALAGVRPSMGRPRDYMRVNVEGTTGLLEACRRHGVRRVVAASSSSVYGNVRTPPSREGDLQAADSPISPYAASKRAMELVCQTYVHLYDLDVTCLRYFTVYGPRQRPDMAIRSFAAHMRAGRPITLFGDGSTSRDYTYVDDAVDGTIRALRRAGGFRLYNLGNRVSVPLSELVARLAAALGVAPRVEHLPEQPGDVRLTCADTSLAEAELGWRAQTPLEEGLQRFVGWLDAGA